MKRTNDVPRLDGAFTPPPPKLSSAVERAFARGRGASVRRRSRARYAVAAAALALLLAALALASSSLIRPRVDRVVASQGMGPGRESDGNGSGLPEASTDEDIIEEEASALSVEEEPTVYYTEGGVYYHGNMYCMGMRNAHPHTTAEAVAAGKLRCPQCQPGEPNMIELFRRAFGMEPSELYPGWKYAYTDGSPEAAYFQWTMSDGQDAGFTPIAFCTYGYGLEKSAALIFGMPRPAGVDDDYWVLWASFCEAENMPSLLDLPSPLPELAIEATEKLALLRSESVTKVGVADIDWISAILTPDQSRVVSWSMTFTRADNDTVCLQWLVDETGAPVLSAWR